MWPVDAGVLGISMIGLFNQALLGKWLWPFGNELCFKNRTGPDRAGRPNRLNWELKASLVQKKGPKPVNNRKKPVKNRVEPGILKKKKKRFGSRFVF